MPTAHRPQQRAAEPHGQAHVCVLSHFRPSLAQHGRRQARQHVPEIVALPVPLQHVGEVGVIDVAAPWDGSDEAE